MIGIALGLVVIGVMLLFIVPWVGIPAGIVGLALLAVWLVGVGRRATGPREAPTPEP
jgi:hypothetical protein